MITLWEGKTISSVKQDGSPGTSGKNEPAKDPKGSEDLKKNYIRNFKGAIAKDASPVQSIMRGGSQRGMKATAKKKPKPTNDINELKGSHLQEGPSPSSEKKARGVHWRERERSEV